MLGISNLRSGRHAANATRDAEGRRRETGTKARIRGEGMAYHGIVGALHVGVVRRG